MPPQPASNELPQLINVPPLAESLVGRGRRGREVRRLYDERTGRGPAFAIKPGM